MGCVNCGGGSSTMNGGGKCCPCPDQFGCCPPGGRNGAGFCYDFETKRYSTKPPFNLDVSDCNGPIDLTNTVVEVNMWANGRLKTAITTETTEFALADNIGFYQSLSGDIILVDRIRSPEIMLVVDHDEDLGLIKVLRGYQGTTPGNYKRGTKLKMFRVLNGMGETETVTENIEKIDGTKENVITESRLIYNWRPSDVCLPGCYHLEFKLLKMLVLDVDNPYYDPTIPSVSQCDMGYGVEWVRRYPISGSFSVRIFDSPTAETLA